MDEAVDLVIVGGGLAGLSLSILCSEIGLKVVLFEKGIYPKHKVCGEYISRESVDFLSRLGLELDKLSLPQIDHFVLTSHHGNAAECALNPGGFGISRFMLDDLMAKRARSLGVVIEENSKVISIGYNQKEFEIKTAKSQVVLSKLCIGAYGRNSGLDNSKENSGQAYIGVKYHVDKGPKNNTIEIHNFVGGYCGISAIEDNKYCLCYLAKADGVKKLKGDIDAFEEQILFQNPFLRERFNAKKLIERVVTSQLHFGVNEMNTEYIKIGDSAGFIPPITGNGMSLAFRNANEIFKSIVENKDLNKIKNNNFKYINQYLKGRINKGIFLQNVLFVENNIFNKGLMLSMTKVPGLLNMMSKQAVGKPF
jgi:menaquinone-9 beta-reductase